MEKNKVRSKEEISGDEQITLAAQNQLNSLLGLPLIPCPLAYQAPKFTLKEIAEYKKKNSFGQSNKSKFAIFATFIVLVIHQLKGLLYLLLVR